MQNFAKEVRERYQKPLYILSTKNIVRTWWIHVLITLVCVSYNSLLNILQYSIRKSLAKILYITGYLTNTVSSNNFGMECEYSLMALNSQLLLCIMSRTGRGAPRSSQWRDARTRIATETFRKNSQKLRVKRRDYNLRKNWSWIVAGTAICE